MIEALKVDKERKKKFIFILKGHCMDVSLSCSSEEIGMSPGMRALLGH